MGGGFVEEGSYGELMSLGGWYAQFYKMQTGGLSSMDRMLSVLLSMLRDGEKTEAIDTLTPEGWGVLFSLARMHKLSSLLYNKIRSADFHGEIPAAVLTRFHDQYFGTIARNTLIFHELTHVLQWIRGANIPVIALKGVHLSDIVYGKWGLRPMNDVDLLVRREDLQETINILMNRQYQKAMRPTDGPRVYSHYTPLTRKKGVFIELHWALAEPQLNNLIDIKGIWHRAKPARIANVDVLVLSPEDLIVHLCVHTALVHVFRGQLRSLFDIVQVIQFYGNDIAWSTVEDIAFQWGVERSVYLVFALARRFAGLSVPEDFMARLRPKNGLHEILESAEAVIFDQNPGVVIPTLARLWGPQGIQDKSRHLMSRFFPSRTRFALAHGVPSNSPRFLLYYPLRWHYLFRYYFPRAMKVFRKEREATESLRVSIRACSVLDWLRSGREDQDIGPGGSMDQS